MFVCKISMRIFSVLWTLVISCKIVKLSKEALTSSKSKNIKSSVKHTMEARLKQKPCPLMIFFLLSLPLFCLDLSFLIASWSFAVCSSLDPRLSGGLEMCTANHRLQTRRHCTSAAAPGWHGELEREQHWLFKVNKYLMDRFRWSQHFSLKMKSVLCLLICVFFSTW